MNKSDLSWNVLMIIQVHVGASWALDRWELVEIVFGVKVPVEQRTNNNMLDRQVREAIATLRSEHHLICNLQDGSGYYMAATLDEYQAFRAVFTSRAQTVLELARGMDKAAAKRWPDLDQPRLI